MDQQDAAGCRWKEVTEARYCEMLDMVPPALQRIDRFLVGEPLRNTEAGEPLFACFVQVRGKFYEALQPMTFAEARGLDLTQEMIECGVALKDTNHG